MFYIDQLCTPSFPIGLVKTESGFIVRSAETGLGRWTLVVAVISLDAYPFLAFSDLTCVLEDTGIGAFWLYSAVVWIFLRSLGVICYSRWVLSVCCKNYLKDWCLINSLPTFLFSTVLNWKFVSAIMVCYFLSYFYFFTKW